MYVFVLFTLIHNHMYIPSCVDSTSRDLEFKCNLPMSLFYILTNYSQRYLCKKIPNYYYSIKSFKCQPLINHQLIIIPCTTLLSDDETSSGAVLVMIIQINMNYNKAILI